jgi:hypothetical protein
MVLRGAILDNSQDLKVPQDPKDPRGLKVPREFKEKQEPRAL